MSDFIFKLKILRDLVFGSINDWYQTIWKHDLDECYCCDGGSNCFDVCGCGGATLRDIYSPVPEQESDA